MKKIFVVLVAAAWLVPAAVVTANEENLATKKDLCVLYAQNCPDRIPTIQEKIKQLQDEIAKGIRVYTQEELHRLEHKLKDAEEVWDFLN